MGGPGAGAGVVGCDVLLFWDDGPVRSKPRGDWSHHTSHHLVEEGHSLAERLAGVVREFRIAVQPVDNRACLEG